MKSNVLVWGRKRKKIRLDFDHNLINFETGTLQLDRPVGSPVFLHVLLLNCDYISLKMFQIGKRS